MFGSTIALALALSLSVGTDGAATADDPARPPTPAATAGPSFTLGAGDALGTRIRVNDIILARRLEAERTQFANVPDQD